MLHGSLKKLIGAYQILLHLLRVTLILVWVFITSGSLAWAQSSQETQLNAGMRTYPLGASVEGGLRAQQLLWDKRQSPENDWR